MIERSQEVMDHKVYDFELLMVDFGDGEFGRDILKACSFLGLLFSQVLQEEFRWRN